VYISKQKKPDKILFRTKNLLNRDKHSKTTRSNSHKSNDKWTNKELNKLYETYTYPQFSNSSASSEETSTSESSGSSEEPEELTSS
jgi:hypothetical protein